MTRYNPPRLLQPDDLTDGFQCRSEEQTRWLRSHAKQAHAVGTARVFAVTEAGLRDVVAYYAWSMASIAIHDSPLRFRRGAGRHPQPLALLARLGVAIGHEGLGLGAGLLNDVISRAAQLGKEIGCRGLLVHAETPQARDFYLHVLPQFILSPSDPLHLLLLMKDIYRTLQSASQASAN